MTDRDDLLRRVRRANPISPAQTLPEEIAAARPPLAFLIEGEDAMEESTRTGWRRHRGALVTAAALAVTLAVGLPLLLLQGHEPAPRPAATTPATEAPTTAAPTSAAPTSAAPTSAPPTAESSTTTTTQPPPAIPEMTWEKVTEPGFEDDAIIWGVIPGGPGLVAVGGIYQFSEDSLFPRNHTAAWVSADGRTWERIGPEGFGGLETDAGRMMAVVEGPAGLVGISTTSGHDGVAWVSADGRSWERVDDPALGGPGAQSLEYLEAGPGGLVAAGYGERAVLIAVSADGTSWTRVEDEALQAVPEWLNGFVSGDFGYILVGQERVSEFVMAPAMWVSADGLEWERIPTDTFANDDPIEVTTELGPIGITPQGDIVVWDQWGNAWGSSDGYDWTPLAPGEVPHTGAIRDGDRVLVAAMEGILVSPDGGTTWGIGLSEPNAGLSNLLQFGNEFIAFADTPSSAGPDTTFNHVVWIGTWNEEEES